MTTFLLCPSTLCPWDTILSPAVQLGESLGRRLPTGWFSGRCGHYCRQPLPGIWDQFLDQFQKLLVLRCLRGDKVTNAMQDFVATNLEPRFIEPQASAVTQAELAPWVSRASLHLGTLPCRLGQVRAPTHPPKNLEVSRSHKEALLGPLREPQEPPFLVLVPVSHQP